LTDDNPSQPAIDDLKSSEEYVACLLSIVQRQDPALNRKAKETPDNRPTMFRVLAAVSYDPTFAPVCTPHSAFPVFMPPISGLSGMPLLSRRNLAECVIAAGIILPLLLPVISSISQ
jgi:hypothetical protein